MAILFGPLLLVGLSDGDWDIKAGNVSSISDWITAIPATYNSQLITLTQDSSNGTLVFTNTNNSITMEKLPDSGTDSAMHATFRLVSQDSEKGPIMSARDAIGKSVMLETFNMPEMVVVQQGPNNNLRVASVESDSGNKSSVFQVVTGLDRKANSVSLESESRKGCFVYGGVSYSAGKNIQLSCKPKAEDAVFQQAVSFTVTRGMSEYFPSSFKVKGLKRNFVLMPLLSLRDESYTVYFNFTV